MLGGRIYAAARGQGARRDGKPITVSERSPGQAIVATGFPFRHKDQLERYDPALQRALRTFEDLRRAGAASLDLCWTAEGVFDGYFELSLGPWDVAAGALIVREAGGVVTDWEGDDRAWLRSGNIVVGPPQVHEPLVEITSSTR
jgi:myo-inositol-1(or 4)-monophosphatase